MPSGTILSGALPDGIYYITGDVQLNNVTIENGAFISDGKIEVSGGFTLNHPRKYAPALANQSGIIEVKNSAQIKGLIYCGGEGMELKGGAEMDVYGSVVAANKDVEIKAFDLLGLKANSTEIISWRDPQNPYIVVP